MDREYIGILEYIRDNTRCCSKGTLDPFKVKKLYDNNLVTGFESTTGDEDDDYYEFSELQITLSGEDAISKKHQTATKPAYIPNKWDNKPIGKIWITACGGVLTMLCLYLISKHFGISL